MRVCLIIPPSPFLLDERVFPFIGVLKIAAVLRELGVAVDVLDFSGYSNYESIVSEYLSRGASITHIGITATTPQLPAATRILRVIRERMPSVPVILGGTHATLASAAAKKECIRGMIGRGSAELDRLLADYDVVVAGDGELAISEAIRPGVRGLLDADHRGSPWRLTDDSYERLPLPARDLIDLSSYRYRIDGVPATTLIAQLGCPFECGFCAGRSSPMLRFIRKRSIDSIVAEIDFLYRTYGMRGFMFYDDELNVAKGMSDLMCAIRDLQDSHGVEFRLRGFIKAELFTREQAEAMFEAGFRWILVGFESGSERILDTIRKKATCEDNERCVHLAHEAGLKVKALMSLGHPGESAETAEATLRWLLSVRPDDFDVTIITPYPGSPYYDEAVHERDDVWKYLAPNGDALYQRAIDYREEADYYKGDPKDGYVAHVWTDHLSARSIVEWRDCIERVVREKLGISYNPSAPAQAYEHSMGQSLPKRILRSFQ